jgi:hypothetical protein
LAADNKYEVDELGALARPKGFSSYDEGSDGLGDIPSAAKIEEIISTYESDGLDLLEEPKPEFDPRCHPYLVVAIGAKSGEFEEYSSRLEAQRVTVGFRAPLTAQVPQADVADLPLFGGAERQQDLFE